MHFDDIIKYVKGVQLKCFDVFTSMSVQWKLPIKMNANFNIIFRVFILLDDCFLANAQVNMNIFKEKILIHPYVNWSL